VDGDGDGEEPSGPVVEGVDVGVSEGVGVLVDGGGVVADDGGVVVGVSGDG